ncbi:bifunctional precorrin-2 dehydrogenase/sirohydrochlorin ferrochelatase [uncultured Tyzzerella sp.]|uniref:precorrin-2 dehydrogenase/sirohydrochlorin ferrochelatase family protein n=1 Tax=uncultured Tyzzerella sp. TaxID=2321398 RepID=UPI002943B138|nr:bifunctional precorrin-2 dehydrogenase/sirohydrochlorin ferrochelatase [uncultured Tyzzerella sp.]
MDSDFSYFPMFVNLKDKNIVIFGAGKIAIRRVKSLIKTGCNITIVAPNILQDFYNIGYKKLNIIKDSYNIHYLKNAFIVFAITDNSDINNKIYIDCKEKNIIVNTASDKYKCDFLFPGVIYKEDYTIGVCSNGKNYKLTKNIISILKNFLYKKDDKI